MAGQLFDIGGLFADILADPKAEKAKDLEYRKGLFGDGSGIGGSLRGMLAEGSQNFNTGVRRGVQQAGTAINPDFDIRTAPDKYRAVVNAINPAAADAEQQYIEATKQYAPNKLPQLMQNIKKNKREEEAQQRLRKQEERAQAQEGREVIRQEQSTSTFENLESGWENTSAQERIALELAELNLENVKDSVARPKAQKEWLLTTQAAKRPGYEDRLNAMSPAEVADEFKRVETMEGDIAKGLRASIETALGSNHDAVGLLKGMSSGQLQSIMSGIANSLITPSTQVVGNSKDGYKMVVTDPLNPTRPTQITLTEGTADPRSLQTLTASTREAVDEALSTVEIDMAEWRAGAGSVTDPQGSDVTGEELLRERAEEFYQLNKPTELELRNLVKAAAAMLDTKTASNETYDSINRSLNAFFPKGRSASSLIDESLN